MKTVISRVVHKNFQLILESDVCDGQKFDTTVKIIPAFDNSFICTIAGDKIPDFVKEFSELINNYKI